MIHQNNSQFSERQSISVPGATVKAPPSLGERIYSTHQQADPFVEEQNSQPLKSQDVITFYPDINDTIFPLSRQMASHALKSVTAALTDDFMPHFERSQTVSTVNAIPNESKGEVVRSILANEKFNHQQKTVAVANYAAGLTGEEKKEATEMSRQLFYPLLDNPTIDSSQLNVAISNSVYLVPQEDMEMFVEKVFSDPRVDSWTKKATLRRAAGTDEERAASYKVSTAIKVLTNPDSDINAVNAVKDTINELPDEHYTTVISAIREHTAQSDTAGLDKGVTASQRAIESLLRGAATTRESVTRGRAETAFNAPHPLANAAQKVYGALSTYRNTSSKLHDTASREIEKFNKDGTETFILPEQYEASVRIIPVASADAWLTAFKNYPAWYAAGFNYVPIEPIQSIHATDSSDKVAVVTTNLAGRSYKNAISQFPQHAEELAAKREVIRDTLTGMNIEHGHLHNSNFVIVPYTKRFNLPDKKRCPRIFAIDFDEAEKIHHREVDNSGWPYEE